MRPTTARLGEFELIDRLLKPLAHGYPGALDLTDDAALVDVPEGRQVVVTKDAMVAGVHFLPEDPPDLVGGKLLRVNLSDLAAMGADPLGYLTALIRPAQIDDAWIIAYCRGLSRDQAEFGLHLLGGDTTSTSGPLVLSLTMLGTVPRGRALRRDGAGVGDDVWVSGTLGDAALGLRVLRGLAVDEHQALLLVDRYRTPRPRVALGLALRGHATAAIDVSDGLAADLAHVCKASGVAAEIETAHLPLSPAAGGVPGALEDAISGGDDYELLFTAPPAERKHIDRASLSVDVPVTRIGRVVAGAGVKVLAPDGERIDPGAGGWRHF
jgi:thiamine-monophosphate kinase